MTNLLRIILILVSVLSFFILIRNIRKSRSSIESAVFWLILSFVLIVFAIFPEIPDALAHLLGIYSTANFLFLCTIFLLLIMNFSMSMRIGKLEDKLKNLVQELALERKKQEDEEAVEGEHL